MLIKFGMSRKGENSGRKSSRLPYEPIICQGEHLSFGQFVGDLAEDSASPLSDFFAFGEERGLDDLQKEETHIVLNDHFFDDVVDVSVKLLHQLIDLVELSFDSLDQDMSQIFVVVSEQSHCLLFGQFQ